MSEIREGAQVPDPLKQASLKFRQALRPFRTIQLDDAFTDLVMPQQAPEKSPLYPPSRPWIDNGDALLLRSLGNTPPTETMERRMATMLDIVSERLPTSQVIQEGLDQPESYSGIRLADFVLDHEGTNMVKLWATMSDSNFEQFTDMVRRDDLPKALTSDQEMKRLLDSSREEIKPHDTARGRLVELCHNEDYYGHDEQGHETVGPMGGPADAEFNSDIDLSEIMERLSTEFPEG